MNYGKNTNEYIEMISNEMEDFLKKATARPEIVATAGQSIINAIYDIKETGESKKISHSQKDLFIADTLFRPLSEIIHNIEIIDLIPIFINTFPYRRKGMSEMNYLKYHVGNYFVEIGNLRYRLTAYLRGIKKAYRKISKYEQIVERIYKILKNYIDKSFAKITVTRDSHVHQFRYSDKEFDRLATLDILRLSKSDKFKKEFSIGPLHKGAFMEVRIKWKKQIKENNVQIEQIIDFYFETLIKIVAPKGSIINPFN